MAALHTALSWGVLHQVHDNPVNGKSEGIKASTGIVPRITTDYVRGLGEYWSVIWTAVEQCKDRTLDGRSNGTVAATHPVLWEWKTCCNDVNQINYRGKPICRACARTWCNSRTWAQRRPCQLYIRGDYRYNPKAHTGTGFT